MRRIDRRLPDWMVVFRKHFAVHHRFPNIVKPQTFSDKIAYRMLFDRRDLLAQMADKYAVRSYVEEAVGNDVLPRVFCVTSDPREIRFEDLPARFVVKATHGSGWVRVVQDKSALDTAELVATCNRWLGANYYAYHREWAYKNIVPRIMVEEFIDDGHQAAPNDYRLYVFSGHVHFIQVEEGRFVDHRRSIFSADWIKQELTLDYPHISGHVAKPHHLQQMISTAEALARDIEFVRVDLYDTPAKIYFGELTTTPMAAHRRFRPYEYDTRFGTLWHLPKNLR